MVFEGEAGSELPFCAEDWEEGDVNQELKCLMIWKEIGSFNCLEMAKHFLLIILKISEK